MVDVCKELSYIAFEYPYRACVVFRNDSNEFSESAESTMGTFAVLAGIRVRDKRLRKKR